MCVCVCVGGVQADYYHPLFYQKRVWNIQIRKMMRLLTCGCLHSWCCWSPPTSECTAVSPGHLSLLRWRDWMASRAWYCPSLVQKNFGKIKHFGDYFFNSLHAELPPSREWLSLSGHREWSSPPDWHHSAPQHPIAIVSHSFSLSSLGIYTQLTHEASAFIILFASDACTD